MEIIQFIYRYEQFDENNEAVLQKKEKIEENLEHFNYYKSESELHMVNNLEKWHKKSKKISHILRNSTEKTITENSNIKEKSSNLRSFNKLTPGIEIDEKRKSESVSLPRIESNMRLSMAKVSYIYKSVRLPDIEAKKREKEKLNEENFVIDEENLIESLRSKIEHILNEKFEIESFTKKGLFYNKIVDNILGKMNKRIHFLDSMLIKKNKQLVISRKETSVVSDKIQSIKTLVFNRKNQAYFH